MSNGADLQNQDGDELIVTLRKKQQGISFGVEGTCNSGNYVYAVEDFYVPFKSEPDTVDISNIQYSNCSNAEVWQKNRFGFVVRAVVTNNGGAWMKFNWSAEI